MPPLRYFADSAKHGTMPARVAAAASIQGRRSMHVKALLGTTGLVGALAWLTLAPLQGETPGTLGGLVSSAEEGAMEGVLISARKEGSMVTTTVVSNDKGQFSFPAGRIEPGKYTLTIR